MTINSETYRIQLPIYEGPLDLLLELIERAELDITKVSLAKITDQYLAYLKRIPEYYLEDLSSFLVIAARLLQIKSEALLPRPPIREAGEEDPGDALARQLVAYKKYKQVAVLLSEREAAGLRSYLRVAAPPPGDPKLDIEGLTVEDLRKAFIEAFENRPLQPSLERSVVAPRVRIRDKVRSIVDAIRSVGELSFSKLVKNATSRLEIIVSLLALLELMKQDTVTAVQDGLFGEVSITPGENWDLDQELEFESEFEE